MAEYIDREAIFPVWISTPSPASIESLCNAINQIPAADVAPVRHGKWEYDPNGMDWGLGAWVCSVCGCKNDNLGMSERINPYLFSGSNFCPNCGAKMDG